jgi:hypothetical protein
MPKQDSIELADQGEAALVRMAAMDAQVLLDAGITIDEATAVARYSGGIN